MELSRRQPPNALDAAHPFAVSLREIDGFWATDEQAAALDDALDSSLIDSVALDRLLARAETAALDVAALGCVLGVATDRYSNRFHDIGMPTPSVRADAGCPEGFWLPPAGLDERAEASVRSRIQGPLLPDDVIDWIRVQLGAWWSIAEAFAPGASIQTISDSGLPEVAGGTHVNRCSSTHSLGDIWVSDRPQTAGLLRCRALYPYPTPAIGQAFGEIQLAERQCILPATANGTCRTHGAPL